VEENKMAEKTTEELLNLIRSKTIGAKKDFMGEIVNYNGVEIEVREPSEKQRASIFERSKTKINPNEKGTDVNFNIAELSVWGMICCCYVPNTNTSVFTEADYDGLLNMPASQLDGLKTIVVKYLNIDRDKIAKNSVATTGDIINFK